MVCLQKRGVVQDLEMRELMRQLRDWEQFVYYKAALRYGDSQVLFAGYATSYLTVRPSKTQHSQVVLFYPKLHLCDFNAFLGCNSSSSRLHVRLRLCSTI